MLLSLICVVKRFSSHRTATGTTNNESKTGRGSGRAPRRRCGNAPAVPRRQWTSGQNTAGGKSRPRWAAPTARLPSEAHSSRACRRRGDVTWSARTQRAARATARAGGADKGGAAYERANVCEGRGDACRGRETKQRRGRGKADRLMQAQAARAPSQRLTIPIRNETRHVVGKGMVEPSHP